MYRPSRICGGEVEIPGGVVTQPLLVDKSRDSGLRLCERYPLGLFHRLQVVEEYKQLVKRIEETLMTSALTGKERKRAQKESFWYKYMGNSREFSMYQATMELFTVMMDFMIDFETVGISITVCHRSRIAPDSHQPLMEQWIEFVDKAQAPKDYKSQWSVNTTFFMPICICLGTGGFLRVILPSVSILKLFPEGQPGSNILEEVPDRVQSLLTLKGAESLYAQLASELMSIPKRRFGLWNLNAVDLAIARVRPQLRELGLDVFVCKLFSMAAEQKLFTWLEFADLNMLPNYSPQYRFTPFVKPPPAEFAKMHKDSQTGEIYVPNSYTKHLRRIQRHNRNKRKLFCQKGSTTFFQSFEV